MLFCLNVNDFSAKVHPPEVPPRAEYSLTETGQSLMPVVMALVDWGQQHFSEVVTD